MSFAQADNANTGTICLYFVLSAGEDLFDYLLSCSANLLGLAEKIWPIPHQVVRMFVMDMLR